MWSYQKLCFHKMHHPDMQASVLFLSGRAKEVNQNLAKIYFSLSSIND